LDLQIVEPFPNKISNELWIVIRSNMFGYSSGDEQIFQRLDDIKGRDLSINAHC